MSPARRAQTLLLVIVIVGGFSAGWWMERPGTSNSVPVMVTSSRAQIPVTDHVIEALPKGSGPVVPIPERSPVQHEPSATHTVRPGDTAWAIARLYGVDLNSLAAVNIGVEDLGLLQAGQVLRLPVDARRSAVGGGPEPASQGRLARPVGKILTWPVDGPISSPFGPRWGRFHSGIDIAANHGTSIRAADSGRVLVASWVDGYGNAIILDHGDGSRTLYAHASKLEVRLGQSVRRGEVIARVGSTGNSTGPHLHFEYISEAPVDPLPYLTYPRPRGEGDSQSTGVQ